MTEKKAPKKKAAAKADITKAAPKPAGMDALMVKLGEVSSRNRAVLEGLHRQRLSPIQLARRLGITPRALEINHVAALVNLINLMTDNGLATWHEQSQPDDEPAPGGDGGGGDD